MTQYKYDVTMSCGGCSGAITRVLKKLEGVDSFDVSLENQSVTVDSATLSEQEILTAIQKTGKPAKATAAIDIETNNANQEALRRSFRGCTVLTIAHRINTILDSDRILVLDHGRVAEFDQPNTLVENPNSIFYSLAKTREAARTL
ncbi:hypothetical protein DFQ26_006612 [Actinomortierella ambigua]|nr:hypothetical protein DFQ26_006612 [Actinomortierella ambigua]